MRRFVALLAVLAVPGLAAADQFGCPRCHSCGGACVLKAEQVTEDVECYDVECEDVCIPALRFPWDSCREPKCGRVRRVTVLKTDSREETSCKYEWVVLCPRCGPIEPDGETKPAVPPAPEEAAPKPPAAKLPAAKLPAAAPLPPTAPPAQAASDARGIWRLHAKRVR